MGYKLVLNDNIIITTEGERITVPGTSLSNTSIIAIDNAIAFPGLINSHDHLDFNLFPALANGLYNNYTEWGKDIHTTHKTTIDNILHIPLPLRLKWGWYKNLLNGVTTVVHHGERVMVEDAGITLFQEMRNLHSVHFDTKWRRRLLNPFAKKVPFVIHCGEGTDAAAKLEIDTLLGMNWWRHPLVGIHGVAMTPEQAKRFKALVWCPASNFFLLGKTAQAAMLGRAATLLFGTDSTLTASWDLWEQLRQARATKELDDEALYHTLTRNASMVWGLRQKGSLLPGADADIVVARKKSNGSFYDDFFATTPADLLLILHKGVVRLYDESLAADLEHAGVDTACFDAVVVHNAAKFVQKGLRGLIDDIKTHYPYAPLPVE